MLRSNKVDGTCNIMIIIIVMIESYEIKGGVTNIIIQKFVKWIKLKEETAAYMWLYTLNGHTMIQA